MALLVFWLSVAGIFYAYAGYPLLIAVLSRVAGRRVAKAAWTAPVSVVIAARNEAARLPAKLRSVLAVRGADQIREILVGSDGSTDYPAAALAEVADSRIRVVEFPEPRGKPAVLNDLLAEARGDIVVMMDARQEVDPGVLEALLQNFADPTVGVVSGELVFRVPGDATATAQGMDAYWRYEKFLRRTEAQFRSVPGATGAIYAFRRVLYRPIPADTILDDVAIPMTVVRQGFRCVFEPAAVVFDWPSQKVGQETARKRRTLGGNAQLVRLMPWLVHPLRNPIWFEFVSHKLARLAVPFLLPTVLVANGFLLDLGFYRVTMAGQALFYLAAGWGWWRAHRGRRGGGLAVPYLFLSLNVTAALGLWDAVRGKTQVQWARPRSPQG